MNRLAIVAISLILVLFSSIVHAQTSPADLVVGGFLDVPWGTPRDQAKKIISQREGVTFNTAESNEQTIFFNGGVFSDFPVRYIALKFFDNQFYGAMVTIKPTTTVKTTWEDLVTGLTKKYGPAIYTHVHGSSATWFFPIEEIMCSDFGGNQVVITYENTSLKERAEEAHRQAIKTKDL